MGLKQVISVKQTLSARVIQSMEILAMNAQEISEHINEVALENPLLEIDETSYEGYSKKEADLQRKIDWLSNTDRQNRVYYRDDYDSYEDEIDSKSGEETLGYYLRSQIINKNYSDTERGIFYYLIECLDEKGYLVESPDELSKELKVPVFDIEKMIEKLKACDPAGVGAKDLSECLLLQLERKKMAGDLPDKYNYDLTKEILENHLLELSKRHFQSLARKLSVKEEKIAEAASLIMSLNPKPASGFSDRSVLHYIAPDIVVVKDGESFTVLVNEYTYPKVEISSYYENLIKTQKDKKTLDYLKERLERVNELKRDLLLRRDTLSRVAHFIVQRQMGFFINGPGNKVPMKLTDMGKELELHESTVSRALSGKYLQCSYGIFPLNYFLESVSVINYDTGEESSREAVLAVIKHIVDNENKSKPLSDEAISKELLERGFKISRRTVNKYRTMLSIPDKGGRKIS